VTESAAGGAAKVSARRHRSTLPFLLSLLAPQPAQSRPQERPGGATPSDGEDERNWGGRLAVPSPPIDQRSQRVLRGILGEAGVTSPQEAVGEQRGARSPAAESGSM